MKVYVGEPAYLERDRIGVRVLQAERLRHLLLERPCSSQYFADAMGDTRLTLEAQLHGIELDGHGGIR
jgi:hypothetical protein